MTAGGSPGRVIGITAAYTPRFLPGDATPLPSYRTDGNLTCTTPHISIRASKGVLLATGGSTSNVNFRRMFDPRLTEVYQVAGEPYTFQDASGELAAMAIGASLWGLANQTLENGDGIRIQRALVSLFDASSRSLTMPTYNPMQPLWTSLGGPVLACRWLCSPLQLHLSHLR
jgi:hypothetical protein